MEFNTAKNLFILVLFLSPCFILSSAVHIGTLLKGVFKHETQHYRYIWKSYIYTSSIQILMVLLLMLTAFILHSFGKGVNSAYGLIPIVVVTATSTMSVFIFLYFIYKLRPNNSFKRDLANRSAT